MYKFGSRKGFSIDTALLEKRLICNAAIKSTGPMMHNISDLEACYDCQLPNIGCLVQELVGVRREASKLFALVLQGITKHACAGCGIG